MQTKPTARHITVDQEFSGQRLDNFLLRELKGVPRSLIYRIVRRGEVRVNEGRSRASTRLRAGDRVRIPPLRTPKPALAPSAAPTVQIAVLYEDDHLLVVDKPAGLAVHAGSGIDAGVIEILRRLRPQDRYLDLVHRLDRDTSGCLVLARRRSALRRLHESLRHTTGGAHEFSKRYLALVLGEWDETRGGVVEIPLLKSIERGGERIVVTALNGLYAKSRFTVVERLGSCTLVEITLHTGRTHQARVHAAARGHPILGDQKYGDKVANARFRAMGLSRLFLHASEVSFPHPASGDRLTVRSPLPAPLDAVLRGLEGEGAVVDNPP